MCWSHNAPVERRSDDIHIIYFRLLISQKRCVFGRVSRKIDRFGAEYRRQRHLVDQELGEIAPKNRQLATPPGLEPGLPP